jgi:hypothetical protein
MAKGKRQSEAISNPSSDPFSARYPDIAARVQDGWIEIGRDDFSHLFCKKLWIAGGTVRLATVTCARRFDLLDAELVV